jgi:RHS repeat-associated protein
VYRIFAGRQVAEVSRVQTGTTVDTAHDKLFFLHNDVVGSASVITGTDGSVVETRAYSSFGDGGPGESSTTGILNGFTGADQDADLGLVNMRGRLYDPKLARFITPDPFVARPFNAQGLNRYTYVENNPLRFVDPSGFDEGEGEGEGGGGRDYAQEEADFEASYSAGAAADKAAQDARAASAQQAADGAGQAASQGYAGGAAANASWSNMMSYRGDAPSASASPTEAPAQGPSWTAGNHGGSSNGNGTGNTSGNEQMVENGNALTGSSDAASVGATIGEEMAGSAARSVLRSGAIVGRNGVLYGAGKNVNGAIGPRAEGQLRAAGGALELGSAMKALGNGLLIVSAIGSVESFFGDAKAGNTGAAIMDAVDVAIDAAAITELGGAIAIVYTAVRVMDGSPAQGNISSGGDGEGAGNF